MRHSVGAGAARIEGGNPSTDMPGTCRHRALEDRVDDVAALPTTAHQQVTAALSPSAAIWSGDTVTRYAA
jgi:hypothetical protein